MVGRRVKSVLFQENMLEVPREIKSVASKARWKLQEKAKSGAWWTVPG